MAINSASKNGTSNEEAAFIPATITTKAASETSKPLVLTNVS
jgi:hypothetical protein